MKKKILSVCMACAMTLGLLTGCGAPAATEQTVETVTPDVPVTGTWTVPDGASLEFAEDGTYTDTSKKNRTGTYLFPKENSDFKLAKIFESVEYITCTGDDGKQTASGAVLQDVMIVYSDLDSKERYYFRDGRDAVKPEAILGKWEDVYDAESTMEFTEEGKLYAFDDTSSYTVGQAEFGTCVTVDDGESQARYAAAVYEQYLILVNVESSSMYLLVKR